MLYIVIIYFLGSDTNPYRTQPAFCYWVVTGVMEDEHFGHKTHTAALLWIMRIAQMQERRLPILLS